MSSPRLITAEKVRRAAAGDGVLRTGRGPLRMTDEARDLVQRLGVKIEQQEGPVEAPPAPSASGQRVQLAIAADHGGYELKSRLVGALRARGWVLADLGCEGKESVDYPDFALRVAQAVAGGDASRGAMIDTVGVASAMVCNKVPGCRAAACESLEAALSSRRHNDANILTLGAARVPFEKALEMIEAWLREDYEGGRHQRRVEKMMALDRRRGQGAP